MVVRLIFTLLVMFLIYKLYRRVVEERRCSHCGRWINKGAAICHHCNTVQDGVEIQRVNAEDAEFRTVTSDRRNRGRRNIMIAILTGGVILTFGWVIYHQYVA